MEANQAINEHGQHRYAHIDALRAFSVLLVVVSHAGLGNLVPGGSGVTIFFAISGFIISHLLFKERDRTGAFAASRFYARRVLKLAPPLLALIVVPTLIYAFSNPIEWRSFAAQVFFVYNWNVISGGGDVLPGSGVVWSLAIEEQFYVAFSVLWAALVVSRRSVTTVGVIAAFCAVVALAVRIYISTTEFSAERTYYGTDTRMDAIALGVLSAVLVAKVGERNKVAERIFGALTSDRVLLAAGVAFAGSLLLRAPVFRETFRYSIQAACAVVFILYGFRQGQSWLLRVFRKVSEVPVLQVIGLASYSIYLVHMPLLAGPLRGMGANWPLAIRAPFLALLGVAAGVVVWRMLEVPIERWKRSGRMSQPMLYARSQ